MSKAQSVVENHPVPYPGTSPHMNKNRKCKAKGSMHGKGSGSQFQTSRILAVALLALLRSSFLAL